MEEIGGKNMAEKVKSFRIDDETSEKFKEIAQKIGGNQQETLAKLIEAFEFQQGKAILTEKKADIEQFERYISAITNMFMLSLENNQNITETVRTEFIATLRSKEDIIIDLQEKIKTLKQGKETELLKTKEIIEQYKTLNSELEIAKKDMNDLTERLKEKDTLNHALNDTIKELKEKLLNASESITSMNELKSKLADEKALKNDLQAEINNLRNELEQQKLKSELEKQQALLEQEREHEKQLQKMTEQYREQLFALLPGKNIIIQEELQEKEPKKKRVSRKKTEEENVKKESI